MWRVKNVLLFFWIREYRTCSPTVNWNGVTAAGIYWTDRPSHLGVFQGVLFAGRIVQYMFMCEWGTLLTPQDRTLSTIGVHLCDKKPPDGSNQFSTLNPIDSLVLALCGPYPGTAFGGNRSPGSRKSRAVARSGGRCWTLPGIPRTAPAAISNYKNVTFNRDRLGTTVQCSGSGSDSDPEEPKCSTKKEELKSTAQPFKFGGVTRLIRSGIINWRPVARFLF